jgi:hypothetical protein
LKEKVCLWIYNYDLVHILADSHTFTNDRTGRGWTFAHHDKIYSPDNDFVKDDFLFVCCQVRPVIEHSGLIAKFDKELRARLFSLYEKGVDEKCILKVDGEKLTVS